MVRRIEIGHQDFETVIRNDYFYIDKTEFIQEWWDNGDSVTLITRPRRFGKTLTMSMVEQFFSVNYADRRDLFEGFKVWENDELRALQGTYPVISLSFANVKEKDFVTTRKKICQLLSNPYSQYNFLMESGVLTDKDRDFFQRVSPEMDDMTATLAVYQLSEYLFRYYGKKAVILLDEYDTPMQEAWLGGIDGFYKKLFQCSI